LNLTAIVSGAKECRKEPVHRRVLTFSIRLSHAFAVASQVEH
jgi:hypothetical protein